MPLFLRYAAIAVKTAHAWMAAGCLGASLITFASVPEAGLARLIGGLVHRRSHGGRGGAGSGGALLLEGCIQPLHGHCRVPMRAFALYEVGSITHAQSRTSRACSSCPSTQDHNKALCLKRDDISITSCMLVHALKPVCGTPVLRWQRLCQREARRHDRHGGVLDSAAEHAVTSGRGRRLCRCACPACAR